MALDVGAARCRRGDRNFESRARRFSLPVVGVDPGIGFFQRQLEEILTDAPQMVSMFKDGFSGGGGICCIITCGFCYFRMRRLTLFGGEDLDS